PQRAPGAARRDRAVGGAERDLRRRALPPGDGYRSAGRYELHVSRSTAEARRRYGRRVGAVREPGWAVERRVGPVRSAPGGPPRPVVGRGASCDRADAEILRAARERLVYLPAQVRAH